MAKCSHLRYQFHLKRGRLFCRILSFRSLRAQLQYKKKMVGLHGTNFTTHIFACLLSVELCHETLRKINPCVARCRKRRELLTTRWLVLAGSCWMLLAMLNLHTCSTNLCIGILPCSHSLNLSLSLSLSLSVSVSASLFLSFSLRLPLCLSLK